MDKFWYRLTDWVVSPCVLYIHEKQLKKYGEKEGKDYIYRENDNGDVAIFTKGSRLIWKQ